MPPFDTTCDGDASPPSPVLDAASGRTFKLPENTVQGCRDKASANLSEAVTAATVKQRRGLERSAETWTVRADMLDRLQKSFEKRDAINRAHEQYEADRVRL